MIGLGSAIGLGAGRSATASGRSGGGGAAASYSYANTQSISLDGVNQYVSAPLAAELQAFGIWFKPNSAIDKSSTAEWLLGIIASWGGIPLGAVTGSVTDEIVMYIGGDGGNGTFRDIYAHASDSISASWHHLHLDWDGTNHRIYIDGVDKWSGSTGTPTTLTTEAIEVGRRKVPPNGAHFFHGIVNCFYVMSAGQSSDNISALYYSGTPTDPRSVDNDNVIGWWPCEEGTGTSVEDLSTNENDGTIINGGTWSSDTP